MDKNIAQGRKKCTQLIELILEWCCNTDSLKVTPNIPRFHGDYHATGKEYDIEKYTAGIKRAKKIQIQMAKTANIHQSLSTTNMTMLFLFSTLL